MEQTILPPAYSPNAPRSTPIRVGALTAGSLLGFGAVAGALGALGATFLASPAGATTFTVTTLDEFGPGSLRSAIDDANSSPGIDTITFSGNLTGLIDLSQSLPDITEGVVIEGPGADAVTISGGGLYHAFTIDTNGTGGVVISGLTVTESVGRPVGSRAVAGGALIATDTPVRLVGMHFVGNRAESGNGDSAGGAVYVNNAAATGDFDLIDSVLSNNIARTTAQNESSAGGGAYVSADNITIQNVTMEGNEADFAGGASFLARTLDIDEISVINNHSSFYGGGAYFLAHKIELTNSSISGNTTDGAVGGAYVATSYDPSNEPSLTISTTRISDNHALKIGGALIGSLGGPAVLDRLTVTGNVADGIGGLSILRDATLSSSTIANNTGSGVDFSFGLRPVSVSVCALSDQSSESVQPAVPALPTPASSKILHSTIAGNRGPGISVGRQEFVVTSLSVAPLLSETLGFSRSLAPLRTFTPSTCESALDEVIISLDHTLAADNTGEDVAAPANSVFSLIEKPNAAVVAGTGTITGVDPGLLPLTSVSDTVSVVPIAMGSKAWNAGSPNFTPPPATDQRGLPRVVEIIDIGSFEVQEVLVVPVVPTFTG